MFTTFIKTKSNKKIDYLSLVIFNKQLTEHIEDNSRIITAKTNSIPKTVNEYIKNHKETIDFLTNSMLDFLNNNNKEEHYREFKIPKRKGGYRHLIEPSEELKTLQQSVLSFLNLRLQIIPHNAAHAFTKQRDAYTNAEVHKNSDYVIKFDFKDFFPSITTELLKSKLLTISHFQAINNINNTFIDALCEIATYKGALPQGSPLSPFLSNLVMVEFDYEIYNKMEKGELPHYRYSRYADDLTFSASFPGKLKELESKIKMILATKYHNHITIKEEKTKILHITDKCYITGIKLNKDHELTYGHEKKAQLKHDICNMLIKFQNNELTKEEAQSILGTVSYMKRIEPEYTKYICDKFLRKFNSKAKTLHEHLKTIL